MDFFDFIFRKKYQSEYIKIKKILKTDKNKGKKMIDKLKEDLKQLEKENRSIRFKINLLKYFCANLTILEKK